MCEDRLHLNLRGGQDKYTTFTKAALSDGSLEDINPNLLMNMDATSFMYEINKKGEKVWVPEKRASGKETLNPKSRYKSSSLNKFIKYYLLMNSNGTIA